MARIFSNNHLYFLCKLLLQLFAIILLKQWRRKIPLITAPDSNKKQDIKIKLTGSLIEEIKNYCSWAEIENNLDHFFSEAAALVLRKDKDWIATKQTKK